MSTGSSFNAQHEISDRVRSKRFGETTASGSIPHPNRKQALKRARLTAGFSEHSERSKNRIWQTEKNFRPESLEAVARRLDAGTVWINQHLNVHPNIPFSGHKNSGIGIEFGEDGLKEFCNLQVIANRR